MLKSIKREVPNYYTTEEFKKEFSNKDGKDELLIKTGINKNNLSLIVAPTGGGKTNALYDFLKLSSGYFDLILICHMVDEEIYNLLKKKAPDGVFLFKGLAEFPDVDEFPDKVNLKKKEGDKVLVVFDDFIKDIKKKENLNKVERWAQYGRKKNKSTNQIYISQSYFDTPLFLRKQLSNIIILRLKPKDYKPILKDFADDVEIENLKKMLNYSTDKQFQHMGINMKAPKGYKYSKNFLEFLNPDEFK